LTLKTGDFGMVAVALLSARSNLCDTPVVKVLKLVITLRINGNNRAL